MTFTIQGTTLIQTNRPQITEYVINIGNKKRTFYISVPSYFQMKKNLSLILLFHGGGETAYTKNNENGIMNYTKMYKTDAVCISFQGQPSNNTYSWNNAFPWLLETPENDIQFVQEVLMLFFTRSMFSNFVSKDKIFASGKSDGAGFCLYLHLFGQIPLQAIGICSGAHFNLCSVNKISKHLQKIKPIPLLMIHGTNDQVMPYKGQHFLDKQATKTAQYWDQIDPCLKNTFTFNIFDLYQFLSKDTTNESEVFSKTYDKKSKKILVSKIFSSNNFSLIVVPQQNHSWQGHKNSGPNSNSIGNLQFDATFVIAQFFNIKYQSTLPKPIYYKKLELDFETPVHDKEEDHPDMENFSFPPNNFMHYH